MSREEVRSKPGYEKLVWKNARELRRLIYGVTAKFPKSEIRRISQMRDSARSIKQNIQEGYRRSTKRYIEHVNIAKGSAEELLGDISDCSDDGLIDESEFKQLDSLTGKTSYLLARLIDGLKRRLTP